MALQASGQIKASEINTELGRTSSAEHSFNSAHTGGYATINTSSASYPDGFAPATMSEWYSYDHGSAAPYSNDSYIRFDRGDALKKTGFSSIMNLSSSQDFTVSMWVRQDATAAAQANQILIDMTTSTSSTANRFFIQYDKNGNRFVVRMRTNATNFTINYEIESNNSSMGLGTNASTLWSSTNRGNVNSDGFCLLTLVYDASQSAPADAFTFYWNDTEIANGSSAGAGARTTKAVNFVTLGNNNHNPTTTAGGFVGAMDEVKIFTSALSASKVSTLYNSGTIANATETYSTGLLTEFEFEGDVADSAGILSVVSVDSTNSVSY